MRTLTRNNDLAAAGTFLGAGLLLLVLVPEVRVILTGAAGDARWLAVLALVLACLGEAQRRARPLLGLAVGTAAVALGPLFAQAISLGVLIVFADLLYCAVRYGSRRVSRTVAVSAGTLLTLTALASMVTDGPSAAVLTLLNLSLVLGLPVLWAWEVRQHRELADAEHERAEQARRVAELDREAAVAAERARMARDLHDVVAGQLSGIALQSEASLIAPDAAPATLRRVLTDVRRDSVSALSDMRAMILVLRSDGAARDDSRIAPPGLDRLGTLLDAARAWGLRVQVDDRRPVGAHVPAAVDLTAHRIVKEALTNAAKHAPGSTVRLLLRCCGGQLVIEVSNDLVPGAAPGDGIGSGLLGLDERARAVGGRVEAGVMDGAWSVRAVLPVAVSAQQQ